MQNIRIAVIGAGWWAAVNNIPALQEIVGVDIAGICSIDEAELKKVQTTFNIPFATNDYKELLDLADLDGVVISSPHILHYEHAKAALKKGCHVLVEKPFTTNIDHARELVKLAENKNRIIAIPHGWNFMPIVAKALELLRKDLIGDIRHVVLQMASPTADLFAGNGLASADEHLLQPKKSTWADPGRAGGYGWGQLTHALGLFYRLVEIEPVELYALVGNSEAGVDYYNAINVRFEKGATGVISGSASMPVAAGKFQVDLRIFGTKGHFVLDLEDGRERVEIETLDGQRHIADIKPGDGSYDGTAAIRYFVDVCAGRAGENMASGQVGCRSIEFLEAMYRSVETGNIEKV